MPAKVKVIKNMGDIKETVDYPDTLGSEFMEFIHSVFQFGKILPGFGFGAFIFDVDFFQSDGSTVNFSAQAEGKDFTYDADGNPLTGTIEKVTLSFEGEVNSELTGINSNVPDFIAAISGFELFLVIDALTGGKRLRFDGNDGEDFITGTKKIDKLFGGGGDDSMDGRGGGDVLRGGAGFDELRGGKGNDKLFGGGGFDFLDGGKGNDRIFGGKGGDDLRGGGGGDKLFGGNGGDRIDGGKGNDAIFGGDGKDAIVGDKGDDTLTGGKDADRFVFARFDGVDTITDFVSGLDTISLAETGIFFDDIETQAENVGDDLHISTLAGTTIIIENFSKEQLVPEDFGF